MLIPDDNRDKGYAAKSLPPRRPLCPLLSRSGEDEAPEPALKWGLRRGQRGVRSVLSMASTSSLLLVLLGLLGRGLTFSALDTCLHLHTEKLILSRTGESVLLQCQFQYKNNFTLDEVHVLWGKEVAEDEYSALVIFDGKNVKRFNENTSFSTNSLLQGQASLQLENVTTTVSGTYLCDVTVKAANSKGRTQVYVIGTGHICEEDLPFQNVYKAHESNTAYGFPNRSIGAIVAVAVLLAIVLSTAVYVRCKKRCSAMEVTP